MAEDPKPVVPAKSPMNGCLKAFLITLAVGVALFILLLGTCAAIVLSQGGLNIH